MTTNNVKEPEPLEEEDEETVMFEWWDSDKDHPEEWERRFERA